MEKGNYETTKGSLSIRNRLLWYHNMIPHALSLTLIPTLLGILCTMVVDNVWNPVVCVLLLFLGTFYLATRGQKVYLLDFSCYKPKPELKVSKDLVLAIQRQKGAYTEDNLLFQKRIMERSGLGQMTYLPEALLSVSNPSMAAARKEAEMVMFGAVNDLLAKTGVRPKDIAVLIVNCSLFSPTPSLSSMIVNHYRMREDVVSYNLGGMGCSAGPISIDLAKKLLLQVHPNSYALVVSLENITLSCYNGNDRSMLISNCIFRMGGAAILLTNKPSERGRSKYQLLHTVRTHKGADEKSYRCVYQQEDSHKCIGVALSKDLTAVAGEALKANITALGPLILPVSEQLLFISTLVARKVFKAKIKPYVPDLKLAFEHFCIHAGGRAVLDGIEKNLKLSEWHMEPSRMTLYRFGNTSSSSLWYELAYMEAKGRIRKGNRTWQIAFGSGFKCNSVVWRALRRIDPAKEKNPWMEEIDDFPVEVPKVATIN